MQSFTTRGKVGHGDIAHIEAGEIQSIGHFTVTLAAFLTDDGCIDARRLAAVHVDSHIGSLASELPPETIVQILLFVVHETFHGLSRAALLPVEEVRRLEPSVAQSFNVEYIMVVGMDDVNLALGHGLTNDLETDAQFAQNTVGNAIVRHLNDH